MTYREAVASGTKVLEEADVLDPSLDAWYLLQMVCKMERSFYYVHGDEDITEEIQNEYMIAIKKRTERIPLQYILGEQEFMGLKFKVNSNVLIPRQDTETLVEEALKDVKPGMHVLDLCTGSGCVLISIMKNMSEIVGTGSDSSKPALLVAKENAKMHEIEADWIRSDLFDNLIDTYDMIVSNPPYIRTEEIQRLMPEVRDFEPYDALDGREDGLFFYRRIVEAAKEYLKPDGYLYLEIGYDQGKEVSALMETAGYHKIEVIKDLAYNDRVVKGKG